MTDKRVLIVEDTKEIARMLQAAFATLQNRVQVVVAPSAEEAIIEIARGKFDLLVIDVRLPGISGLELTRKLRARNKNMRVAQISGINDPEIREQALKVGADVFFPKPLAMGEFLSAVARLLDLEEPPGLVSVQGGEIPDLLAGLRGSLNAAACILLDERGWMIAQAGVLPDIDIQETVIPALLASLSITEQAARPLGGMLSENLVLVRGEEWDFLAASAGLAHTLVLVLQRANGSVRLAIALDELLAAQKEVRRLLTEVQPPQDEPYADPIPEAMPAAVSPAPAESPSQPAPMPVPVEPQALASTQPAQAEEERAGVDDLEALFQEKSAQPLKSEELDDFWEQLAREKKPADLDGQSDMLSYEQASRLGLTPVDGDG